MARLRIPDFSGEYLVASVIDAKNDYVIADIGLAEFGRAEIRIAETEMPGLMAIREDVRAQIVAQMRHAFYPSYDISWVSPAYVLLIAAVCFALGLVGLYRYIFDVLDI